MIIHFEIEYTENECTQICRIQIRIEKFGQKQFVCLKKKIFPFSIDLNFVTLLPFGFIYVERQSERQPHGMKSI